MPGAKRRVRYVSDNNVNYATRMDDAIADALGFTDAQVGDLTLPGRFKMRHAVVSWFSAGGAGQAVGRFTRSVPVPTLTHGIWTDAIDTVSLRDYNSVPGAGQTSPFVMRDFTVTGLVGEKRTK
jgi:hypothetical protein